MNVKVKKKERKKERQKERKKERKNINESKQKGFVALKKSDQKKIIKWMKIL